MLHLRGLLGPDGEVLNPGCQLIKALTSLNSAQDALGEEGALAALVTQEQDVQCLHVQMAFNILQGDEAQLSHAHYHRHIITGTFSQETTECIYRSFECCYSIESRHKQQARHRQGQC